MTKEQFEILKPFELEFYRYKNYNFYCPFRAHQKVVLYNVFNEITGLNENPKSKCKKCLDNVIEYLCNEYYSYIESIESGVDSKLNNITNEENNLSNNIENGEDSKIKQQRKSRAKTSKVGRIDS